jgi:hypothetical protein
LLPKLLNQAVGGPPVAESIRERLEPMREQRIPQTQSATNPSRACSRRLYESLPPTSTNEPAGSALSGLAEYVPSEHVSEILTAATDSVDSLPRAYTLKDLAPQLEPEQLLAAREAATSITNHSAQANCFLAIVPYLPPADALALAETVEWSDERAEVLSALAPHLPANLLTQALAASPVTSAQALIQILNRGHELLPEQGPHTYVTLLRSCLERAEHDVLLEITASQHDAIARLGGDVALTECAGAIMDILRWWP